MFFRGRWSGGLRTLGNKIISQPASTPGVEGFGSVHTLHSVFKMNLKSYLLVGRNIVHDQ